MQSGMEPGKVDVKEGVTGHNRSTRSGSALRLQLGQLYSPPVEAERVLQKKKPPTNTETLTDSGEQRRALWSSSGKTISKPQNIVDVAPVKLRPLRLPLAWQEAVEVLEPSPPV